MKPKYRMLSKEVSSGDIRTAAQCGAGSCPSVFLRNDGKFVVIGKALDLSERSELEGTGMVRIYSDEVAIVVDPQLLQTAFKER